MIDIYCYTWNLSMPPEGVFDCTCGYHAIRYGTKMLNILNKVNPKINDDYIIKIKKDNLFDDFTSKYSLLKDIEIYKKHYNSNFLARSHLNIIINGLNLNKNIFIIYLDNENLFNLKDREIIFNILRKNNYKICFIFFKEFMAITHWVPIVFDRQDDKVYIHILDSYDYTWFGDISLNKLVNLLYPYNKRINCKMDLVKGRTQCFLNKLIEFIVIVVIIILFVNGLFTIHKIK